MDPVSLVVTAIALGAAAMRTGTTSAAVDDAYAGLRSRLAGSRVDLSDLERDPASPAERAALTALLANAVEVIDEPVLAAARRLTAAVTAARPDAARIVGMDLQAGSARSAGDRAGDGRAPVPDDGAGRARPAPSRRGVPDPSVR